MLLHPLLSKRTNTLFPSRTLFRSPRALLQRVRLWRPDRTARRAPRLARQGVPAVDTDTRPLRTPPTRRRESGRSSASACLGTRRSEEHTYELQSLMHISDAVLCLKKNKTK